VGFSIQKMAKRRHRITVFGKDWELSRKQDTLLIQLSQIKNSQDASTRSSFTWWCVGRRNAAMRQAASRRCGGLQGLSLMESSVVHGRLAVHVEILILEAYKA
jgi:hypothetical protein